MSDHFTAPYSYLAASAAAAESEHGSGVMSRVVVTGILLVALAAALYKTIWGVV